MSFGRFLREKIVEPLRRAQGTPESIARGGAIGLFIALTPTVGVQSLLVTAVAVPMRANLPVSLVMCWITNPVTLIPFYFSYYWVGSLLLGLPPAGYAQIGQRISEQFAMLNEASFLESMRPLGREILWPMCLGSMVLATLTAVPTYCVLVSIFRKRELLRAATKQAVAREADRLATVEEGPASPADESLS